MFDAWHRLFLLTANSVIHMYMCFEMCRIQDVSLAQTSKLVDNKYLQLLPASGDPCQKSQRMRLEMDDCHCVLKLMTLQTSCAIHSYFSWLLTNSMSSISFFFKYESSTMTSSVDDNVYGIFNVNDWLATGGNCVLHSMPDLFYRWTVTQESSPVHSGLHQINSEDTLTGASVCTDFSQPPDQYIPSQKLPDSDSILRLEAHALAY